MIIGCQLSVTDNPQPTSDNKFNIVQQLIPTILLLPLLGFLIAGLLGNRLSKSVVGAVASLAVLGAFMGSLYLFGQTGRQPVLTAEIFQWMSVGDFHISMGLLVDRLSVWMMMIITGIGFLIHVYAIGYMHDDEGFARFFAYLNLFVFFMLLLVMADNYLVLFFGWEGVGLCSYLLIGFWHQNESYGKAARKAFIMNRIGDLGLLIGIFMLFQLFGSLNYLEIFDRLPAMRLAEGALTVVTILLFIGAIGKSAQIPLYTWLPDAMAGPTPVSALIHAATMVTAGIYLLVRSSVLFELAPVTLEIVAIVGLATAIFAALIGLRQNDIKKVLAYSTVSQLGLMFLALGVGAYTSAMFHLTTHAFFKALLFLGAGSVIHAMSGEQDIRRMGGLRAALPITYWTFAAGTLAIAGFPLLSGFFSKDEILAQVFAHSPVLWALALMSSAITVIYMMRLFFLTFYGEFRGTAEQRSHLHESPAVMTWPLIALAVLSVIGGVINLPAFIVGENGQWLSQWYHTLPGLSGGHSHHLSHAAEWALMGLTTVVVLAVIGICYRLYVTRKRLPSPDEQLSGWELWASRKFYIDELYEAAIVKPLEQTSGFIYRIAEIRIIDGIVNLTGVVLTRLSQLFRLVQNGNISYYLFGMVLGLILILLLNFII